MKELFDIPWFKALIVLGVILIIGDELHYYWWKQDNPGSMYSTFTEKTPLHHWEGVATNNYPNGYRPAGAG